jgi:hypothetical protein
MRKGGIVELWETHTVDEVPEHEKHLCFLYWLCAGGVERF